MKDKDKAVVDGDTPDTYMVTETPLTVTTSAGAARDTIPAYNVLEAQTIVDRLNEIYPARFHVGTYPRPH